MNEVYFIPINIEAGYLPEILTLIGNYLGNITSIVTKYTNNKQRILQGALDELIDYQTIVPNPQFLSIYPNIIDILVHPNKVMAIQLLLDDILTNLQLQPEYRIVQKLTESELLYNIPINIDIRMNLNSLFTGRLDT